MQSSVFTSVLLPLALAIVMLGMGPGLLLLLPLMVVALYPGDPSSKLLTYLARRDVALSITLTAVSSVITVVMIPLFTHLALGRFLGESAVIALPIGFTMLQVFLVTLLPIAITAGLLNNPDMPVPAPCLRRVLLLSTSTC
jgi:BASS family bile acid:Na+ symporter